VRNTLTVLELAGRDDIEDIFFTLTDEPRSEPCTQPS